MLTETLYAGILKKQSSSQSVADYTLTAIELLSICLRFHEITTAEALQSGKKASHTRTQLCEAIKLAKAVRCIEMGPRHRSWGPGEGWYAQDWGVWPENTEHFNLRGVVNHCAEIVPKVTTSSSAAVPKVSTSSSAAVQIEDTTVALRHQVLLVL